MNSVLKSDVEDKKAEGIYPYFEALMGDLEDYKNDFRLVSREKSENSLERDYNLIYENEQISFSARLDNRDRYVILELESEFDLQDFTELLDEHMNPDLKTVGDERYSFGFRK